ncbi:uncharacterized protein LOC143240105 isoform X1 [Tachypleus tridentatus]|uniref:uncharacterized protein LOC143240105 isoform X1 n=1 Tax=Tachypleus tridentatus TaxID=6853 RepID=UPI003FD403AE
MQVNSFDIEQSHIGLSAVSTSKNRSPDFNVEEAILIRTTTCVSQIREPYSLGITVGNLELRMKLPTKGKAAKRTHLHKIRTNDKRKDGQQHLLSKFMCVLITFSTQDASP